MRITSDAAKYEDLQHFILVYLQPFILAEAYKVINGAIDEGIDDIETLCLQMKKELH
jgi:hypothetical protein